jgi:hypothetical protein
MDLLLENSVSDQKLFDVVSNLYLICRYIVVSLEKSPGEHGISLKNLKLNAQCALRGTK